MRALNLHTWTGWGSVTHWNAFVANLEMHGQGTFYDPRLDDATRFPVAAAHRFGHVRNDPDLVTPKLGDLHLYQLALAALGVYAFQASRSPDGRYRTTPLRGLWTHPARGYYPDGRFATLGDVVDHYDAFLGLDLGAAQKADLVEYLKSL